jgi:ABC-type methionine transport system ATPase subunit
VPARKPLVRSVGPQRGAHGGPYSKRCWFTFPSRNQVEQPIIWQMSRKFPDVMFDIRQASVQNEIGIMAVLLSGKEEEVNAAMEFMRSKGVTVEPIEKSVVEG